MGNESWLNPDIKNSNFSLALLMQFGKTQQVLPMGVFFFFFFFFFFCF